jgi:type III secretion protein W
MQRGIFMSSDLGGIPQGFDRGNVTLEAMKNIQKDTTQELSAEQTTSKEAFATDQKDAINPFAAQKKQVTKPSKSRIQKMMESKDKGEGIPIQFIKDTADQFQRRNPELKSGVLVLLRSQVKPGDKKDAILKKIKEFYTDVSLADEALEYLFETTEGELHNEVQEALAEFRQDNEREIAAGRNINEEARAASEKGLGTPSNMRDLYRDITGNPRDSATLFDQLAQKYAFKELKSVVDFLLHSLGTDMKAKGPSIPRGELHRLITETRSLQAILGVYRFFNNRMNLVNSMFEREGEKKPDGINFESLSKAFMALVSERYPSSEKVQQQAIKLGCDKHVMAKIIALTQLRDAIREVAMNQIYRSLAHRDELYLVIIEALEDLEDELEELLSNQEEIEDDDKDDLKKATVKG